jgi:predicted outer membrane lipoprotein
MSMVKSESELRRQGMERFTAADLRTYRVSAWINGVALATAFVLLVATLVLEDADMPTEQVVSATGPHAVAVVQRRK